MWIGDVQRKVVFTAVLAGIAIFILTINVVAIVWELMVDLFTNGVDREP